MTLLLRLALALALLPLRFALALVLAPLRALATLTSRTARRTYRRLGAAAGAVVMVRDRRFAHPAVY